MKKKLSKKIMYTITILSLFGMAMSSMGMLSLELTQGTRSRLPIAIVSLEGEQLLLTEQQTSRIIIDDFGHSGEFSVFSGAQLPEKPHNLGDIHVSRWHGFSPQYVVFGKVQAIGVDQYTIEVTVVNLYRGQEGDKVLPSAVMFKKSYTVNQQQLRRVAHHISDDIYSSLLGVSGVFSSKIAYILVQPGKIPAQPNYHLVVADYDGYNPRFAANSNQPMMSPAWSPDGHQIAFVSFQKTLPAIFIVDIRTGILQQVTELAGINGAPAWSPDGKSLAFVSSQTGAAKLYVIDLASRQVSRLTDGVSIDTEPHYMPDGRSLVFTSNRGGGPQIYQYTFATKRVERLTYVGDYNASANISPDGKWMTLLHRDKNGFNVAVQNLMTDQFKLLTHDNEDESPKFSPNSQLILYATHTGHKHLLAIVSVDGQIHLLLPANDGNIQEPSWSK